MEEVRALYRAPFQQMKHLPGIFSFANVTMYLQYNNNFKKGKKNLNNNKELSRNPSFLIAVVMSSLTPPQSGPLYLGVLSTAVPYLLTLASAPFPE
jgi:hypothetical protein